MSRASVVLGTAGPGRARAGLKRLVRPLPREARCIPSSRELSAPQQPQEVDGGTSAGWCRRPPCHESRR